jgi:hypothetical protein
MPPTLSQLKRKAGRIGGKSRSPAKLAASRANLAKANAALAERGLTPEHIEKLRRNLIGARAARTQDSIIRQARKVLRHGLFSRHLRATAVSLGENPRDFDSLLRQTRRYLNPQNEVERKLCDLIGRELWRHHRVHYAQAKAELRRLLFFFRTAPPLSGVDSEVLIDRGYILLTTLVGDPNIWCKRDIITGTIARLLRRLIRLRAGNPKLVFRTHFHPPTAKDEERLDRLILGNDFVNAFL